VTDILQTIAEHGLDHAAYMDVMREQAAADPDGLAGEAAERLEFTRLNLHRSERIARHWRPSDELARMMGRLAGPQTWLVLTEPWCGDSAQCLPCLGVLADGHPAVTLRLLLRDSHLEVMDRFLTDGKRAIPILAALDAGGRELFRWGPRPAAAQTVFAAAKAEGLDKPQILEKLHLFYGRDRGRALDTEFVALLGEHLDGAPARNPQ
jgi:hypothetical protein